MIYLCYNCNKYFFDEICPVCGVDKINSYIPLDPKYYPEFKYQSQGLLKDLLFKKKTEKNLQDKLNNVLNKYYKFKDPYFINYLHIDRKRYIEKIPDELYYSKLQLFNEILVRLGFGEISEFEKLTEKLLKSTELDFEYTNFVQNISKHIKVNLHDSLVSWIEEKGALFRKELPLFLYYLWQYDKLNNEVHFDDTENIKDVFVPLVSIKTYFEVIEKCEKIYFEVVLDRFKSTLEKFDPQKYLTIYKIDSMSGYEFEAFLVQLFSLLGYEVEETKKTKDQGADLFIKSFGKRIVVQAKNYIDNIGNAAVQQAISAKNFYNCDKAYVITRNL